MRAHELITGGAGENKLNGVPWRQGSDITAIPIEFQLLKAGYRFTQQSATGGIADFIKHAPHHRRVALLMGGNARLNHALPGNDGKIKVMACGMCELLHEHALRPPITFTEGVSGIEFCHYVGGAFGEFFARQTAQIIGGAQLRPDAVERGGNGGADQEWLPLEFFKSGSVATVPSDRATCSSRVWPAHSYTS